MNDARIPKLMCEYTPKWPTKHKSDHVEPWGKDRSNGRASRHLPGAQTYNGRWDVSGIIVCIVLLNESFHTRKNFSEKS